MNAEELERLQLGHGDQIEIFYKTSGGVFGRTRYFDRYDKDTDTLYTGGGIHAFGALNDVKGEPLDNSIHIEIRKNFDPLNYNRPEFNIALTIEEKIELGRPPNQMGSTFEEIPEE